MIYRVKMIKCIHRTWCRKPLASANGGMHHNARRAWSSKCFLSIVPAICSLQQAAVLIGYPLADAMTFVVFQVKVPRGTDCKMPMPSSLILASWDFRYNKVARLEALYHFLGFSVGYRKSCLIDPCHLPRPTTQCLPDTDIACLYLELCRCARPDTHRIPDMVFGQPQRSPVHLCHGSRPSFERQA